MPAFGQTYQGNEGPEGWTGKSRKSLMKIISSTLTLSKMQFEGHEGRVALIHLQTQMQIDGGSSPRQRSQTGQPRTTSFQCLRSHVRLQGLDTCEEVGQLRTGGAKPVSGHDKGDM